jgi:hypothetical protein
MTVMATVSDIKNIETGVPSNTSLENKTPNDPFLDLF